MNNVPFLGYNVYDPKDLTVEQLMKVLGLDERHRIVDMNGEAIIVDWEAFLNEDKVRTINDNS